jgi:hypothetical protein
MKNVVTWRETGVKSCTKCEVEKPIEEFSFSRGYAQWCKECHREAARISSKKRTPEQNRTKHLKRAYNLTAEEFTYLVMEQGGVCGICGLVPSSLFVDHNHQTGEVRGLLCQKCNSGIGFLGDSLEGLEKAINYLKKTDSKEII